ncbi:LPXTG cell wall anchor domain-containing protein [Streptomyces sp. CRN 30]|uniref:LPXTG cell wall anchor domain-containing protein n=1 Tax=Streptomyces sp. CRN 30 TaxID=3075613 RepID=UPI002A840F81|nr:LPXTG cell wall anchor domain-containing protein [Streptomyces sp. CRN 30]
MAAAAATAVIAPVALLAAPVAYATESTSPEPSVSTSATEGTGTPPAESATQTAPEENPSTTPPAENTPPAESTSPPENTTSPSADPTVTNSTSPSPSASETEGTESPEPGPTECADGTADVIISGLPGKIAAGSGWHEFTLTVANNTDATMKNLDYLAGASADEGAEDLFTTGQISLQAFNPQTKAWETLSEDGYAIGWVGYSEELAPDHEVEIPLRIDVKKSAPAGAAFSIGATIYGDESGECYGYGYAAYKFQIVAAGTDTTGTKPQTGGKAPVSTTKPAADTPKVTGNLAETGAGSALPVIGLVGGFAVVAGAGAVYTVRRRKAGTPA